MTARRAGDVVEMTCDCEVGALGERAVVFVVDGAYMTLIFPGRDIGRRVVMTGADYKYARRV